MKKVLFRGTFLAALGALLLFSSYMMMPPPILKVWGFPIVIVGFLFILTGMIPYKRLSSLETKPHEIHLDRDYLFFLQKGIPLFRVRLEAISDLDFVETKELYGVGIQLKRPVSSAITLLQPHKRFATFTALTKQKVPNADLFLPYFSEHSELELKSWLFPSIAEE